MLSLKAAAEAPDDYEYHDRIHPMIPHIIYIIICFCFFLWTCLSWEGRADLKTKIEKQQKQIEHLELELKYAKPPDKTKQEQHVPAMLQHLYRPGWFH